MSENAAAPPAAKKERGPRRESTRIAAACKIATETDDPASLATFLGMKTDERGVALKGLCDEAAAAETKAKALKAKYLAFGQFHDETTGFGGLALVQVKAVLDARLAGTK